MKSRRKLRDELNNHAFSVLALKLLFPISNKGQCTHKTNVYFGYKK